MKPLLTTSVCALLLSGCASTVRVAPALPVCPEPLVFPRSFTDPLNLPAWFPRPTTPSSPTPLLAQVKCTPTPKP